MYCLNLLVLRVQVASLTTHLTILYVKYAALGKKVIKTVISGGIHLFDLYFCKAYLIEVRKNKGNHSGKRGK